MKELSAAAPPRDSPAARGGQRRREPDARQAQLHDLSSSPYARMDAEMLEVVMTFEQVYATLEPPREAADPDATLLGDDLFPAFPDDFDIPQRRTTETARVLSVWPEREIVRSITPAGRVAPAAQQTLDIDLDEAMSILRDAEEKGRAASMESRYHEPELEPGKDTDEGLNVTMPEPVIQRTRTRPVAEPPAPVHAPVRPRTDEPMPRPAPGYFLAWTARSHRMQSFAIGGVIVALIVGLALGYTVGRVSDFRSAGAKVHASGQGGTHLRVDYELRSR